MTDRVNLKTDEAIRERLRSLKREGETWDGLLIRAAESLEARKRKDGQSAAPICASCGELASTWTIIDGAVQCGECAAVDFDV